MNTEAQQEHSLVMYLKVWLLLFVLSTASYLVDFFQLQGLLRWSMVLIFMSLKAGLIISVFMHLGWERLALKYLVLLPPLVLIVLVGLMAIEADYTLESRMTFFDTPVFQPRAHP